MTLRPHTVLLDIDGTLLDTREFILSAFEHTFRSHGGTPPPRDILSARVGLPLEHMYEELTEAATDVLIETHRSFQEQHLHLVTHFPGVHDALENLRAQGISMAAVTSRSRRTSLATLELAGIEGFFETVVSAEDTPALKPDPAPLRLALARLRAEAPGAVMVGDTAHDVHAGRAAGVHTVAVTYGFQGQAVIETAPDAVIHDVRELPLAIASLKP
jgi:pyrophosphatase PpaX